MEKSHNDSAAERVAAAGSDEQLMMAFAGGDRDGFNALFLRYRQPLFGYFRRRTGDPALAEELAQEAFVAVLRGAARYRPSALFRTWLYAIAFRILRAHRRKAAWRATFFGLPPEVQEPAAHSALEAEVQIRQAVARLDPTDREIVLLREFEQLSYAEIAEVLALPLNTVRSRLFRARMALHEVLCAPAKTSSAKDLSKSEEYA